ncbi:hypothetical protein [Halomonas rhizosphaerae]|uniref:Uncharacterized protein n=1 Tax=Halomonas rhizosphaerae TaxID=3043296 RepID=A0ABT6V1T5_9GAMM|nr:hypothetical protein [Halomonas rhizosphaerae]MDI5892161.1 hypothetical protein [Halomonas rhizosphaerae]
MAFFKGSAYEFTPLFERSETGAEIFRGLRARRIRHPDPVLEHTVALKERLDGVAHEYYSESRDWRWLVEANPDILFPEDLLWDTRPPDYDEDGNMTDPGTMDENGRERVGQVIIVPRRGEAG